MKTIEFRHRASAEEATFRLRDLIRGNGHWKMPHGPQGFVAEDLDLVVRWFGPDFNLDSIGRLRLVEMKRSPFYLDTAQVRTFGPLAERLEGWERFDGFYVVQTSNEQHDAETIYTIDGLDLSSAEFRQWLLTPVSPIERWHP